MLALVQNEPVGIPNDNQSVDERVTQISIDQNSIDLDNINNVQKEDFAPSENKKRYHRESFVPLLFEHIDLVFLFLTA